MIEITGRDEIQRTKMRIVCGKNALEFRAMNMNYSTLYGNENNDYDKFCLFQPILVSTVSSFFIQISFSFYSLYLCSMYINVGEHVCK